MHVIHPTNRDVLNDNTDARNIGVSCLLALALSGALQHAGASKPLT